MSSYVARNLSCNVAHHARVVRTSWSVVGGRAAPPSFRRQNGTSAAALATSSSGIPPPPSPVGPVEEEDILGLPLPSDCVTECCWLAREKMWAQRTPCSKQCRYMGLLRATVRVHAARSELQLGFPVRPIEVKLGPRCIMNHGWVRECCDWLLKPCQTRAA